jgi:hypothetical protein
LERSEDSGEGLRIALSPKSLSLKKKEIYVDEKETY